MRCVEPANHGAAPARQQEGRRWRDVGGATPEAFLPHPTASARVEMNASRLPGKLMGTNYFMVDGTESFSRRAPYARTGRLLFPHPYA
jgi:hypothetical protein